MEDDINNIYSNGFGMSFRWKNASINDIKKIQIIFRDTAISLTIKEINYFSYLIEDTFKRVEACNKCLYNNPCKSILLETPIKQINFAINYKELTCINDLIKGTLFSIEFDSLLDQNTIEKNI